METATQVETFQQLWAHAVHSHGNRTFLVFRDSQDQDISWTYAEFDRLVSKTAGLLTRHGVERGDSIHLALKNCPALVLIWLAASRLGAWIVPVDPASAARDIASQIRRTTPKIGFCASARRTAYLESSEDLLDVVVELSESVTDTLEGSALLGKPVEATTTAPNDRLAVMFTSGTTSEPKGVSLTQRNYLYVSQTMSAIINLQGEDRWFVTLPLFHANAQYYCFGPAIAAGASVALTAAFSASGWFRHAAELEVTHASLFAAPIRMILARRPDDAPKLRLKHLWFAQSLGQAHYREFAELIGCKPRQLYGMTETTAIVTADMSSGPRHDVIGTPVMDRTIQLLDPETGEPVEVGNPGMIMVQGTRGLDLFEGYLNDPVTTGNSFTVSEGLTWFRTGDLAKADANGVLRFVGRIDDVIKVAGENVSLTEIEATLAQAPGVLEVAVLAKPDPIREQVPVAFVVPRNAENPPSIGALREWAESSLPPQSRPREWSIIDELPRTSVGKIQRFRLTAAANNVPAQA